MGGFIFAGMNGRFDRGDILDFSRVSTQQQAKIIQTLPPEVRRLIYRHVCEDAGFTQHVVRMQTIDSPLGHVQLTHSKCSHRGAHLQDLAGLTANRQKGSPQACRIERIKSPDPHMDCVRPLYDRGTTSWGPFLPLLLSCKTIYIEFSQYLYSNTEFSFSEIEAMRAFMDRVSNQHLSRIRLIHCLFKVEVEAFAEGSHWYYNLSAEAYRKRWSATWARVAQSMPSLARVVLQVSPTVIVTVEGYYYFKYGRYNQDRLLEPLRATKAAQVLVQFNGNFAMRFQLAQEADLIAIRSWGDTCRGYRGLIGPGPPIAFVPRWSFTQRKWIKLYLHEK